MIGNTLKDTNLTVNGNFARKRQLRQQHKRCVCILKLDFVDTVHFSDMSRPLDEDAGDGKAVSSTWSIVVLALLIVMVTAMVLPSKDKAKEAPKLCSFSQHGKCLAHNKRRGITDEHLNLCTNCSECTYHEKCGVQWYREAKIKVKGGFPRERLCLLCTLQKHAEGA